MILTIRSAAFLILAILLHGQLQLASAGEWKRATETGAMKFPTDHFSHPEYKTEWWYFTGNLQDEDGSPIGIQFTLFRQGMIPPGQAAPDSHWAAHHVGFGHVALSFPDQKAFHFGQVLERGSLDSAEFPEPANPTDSPALLARVKSWAVTLLPDGRFHLKADYDGHALDLVARPLMDPVLQGDNGLSQKSAGEGNASRYYSIPRLETTGTITSKGRTHNVRGTTWLDREWASNQLGPGQIGWDWFALQLDDGRDIMVYQMRRTDGTRDPFSHGSLRRPDGSVVHLRSEDFQLTPRHRWKSPVTGGDYPIAWQLTVPGHDLSVDIQSRQDAQELALQPVAYYEGAVSVNGPAGRIGLGYMEMTGYAKALEGLQSKEALKK